MRSASMQALTNQLKLRFPGIVIYGIGDDEHRTRVSDHNEDDTPGVIAGQTDSDSTPEHRAIDAMIGSAFPRAEAKALITRMVKDQSTTRRLYYIIFDGTIWSRSTSWVGVDYESDDDHSSHVHFSGWADDDANGSAWPVVMAASGSGPTIRLQRAWPAYMPLNHFFGLITGSNRSHGGFYPQEKPDIKAIQDRLNKLKFNAGAVDGIFGNKTKAAVADWQRKFYANKTTLYGEVWKDDWTRLFTY